MALIVYSNGVVEEMVSIDNVFTDAELSQSFDDYDSIRSFRLPEIPNTWCVWGESEDELPENEFNRLATEIIGDDIMSHIMFVHDSEINPNWNLTEQILYKDYSGFLQMIGDYINHISREIATESMQEMEESESKSNMIFLVALGHTDDKRVMFGFNPNEQSDDFYTGEGWDNFSGKINEYLAENFYKEPVEYNKPFAIYSDAKTIVIIEDEHVDDTLSRIIKHFEINEKYENCSFMIKVKKDWDNRKTIPQTINGAEPKDPSHG